MVEMSQKPVQQELTLEQLKICLIALDVFNTLIKNPTLQPLLIDSAQKAETFFGFNPDIKKKLSNTDAFSDKHIGLTCDKLFDLFEDLEALTLLN